MKFKTIFKHIPIIVLLAALQFSCTEVFFPKIEAGNGALVVDGKITNLPGPYEIKLFRTAAFEADSVLPPETGAIIIIYDDKGNSDTFIETAPGVYHNQSGEFTGTIGNSYWIEITTSDGKTCESIPEVMPPAVEIDSIYGEEVEVVRGLDDIIDGVEFYFDAVITNQKNMYVRWEHEESWEFRVLTSVPKTETPAEICFPVSRSNTIQLFDASYLEETKIQQKAFAVVTGERAKLPHKYVLNLTLYSTTKMAYDFWNNLKEVGQNQGALHSVIPSNLQGNIQACQENSPVLGYFEVGSAYKKAKAFNSTDFHINFPIEPEECEILIYTTSSKPDIPLDAGMPGGTGHPDPLRDHILDSLKPNSWTTRFYFVHNQCVDCAFKYPINKPSFWP